MDRSNGQIANTWGVTIYLRVACITFFTMLITHIGLGERARLYVGYASANDLSDDEDIPYVVYTDVSPEIVSNPILQISGKQNRPNNSAFITQRSTSNEYGNPSADYGNPSPRTSIDADAPSVHQPSSASSRAESKDNRSSSTQEISLHKFPQTLATSQSAQSMVTVDMHSPTISNPIASAENAPPSFCATIGTCLYQWLVCYPSESENENNKSADETYEIRFDQIYR